jgi:hypothetical protein
MLQASPLEVKVTIQHKTTLNENGVQHLMVTYLKKVTYQKSTSCFEISGQ